MAVSLFLQSESFWISRSRLEDSDKHRARYRVFGCLDVGTPVAQGDLSRVLMAAILETFRYAYWLFWNNGNFGTSCNFFEQ